MAPLRVGRRATVEQIAEAMQRDETNARKKIIERLVDAGLVEPRGRSYTLSAKVYCALDDKAACVRQAGFHALQQEQMVVTYAKNHGSMRRSDMVEPCRITPRQATRLLSKLVAEEQLVRKGTRRAALMNRRREVMHRHERANRAKIPTNRAIRGCVSTPLLTTPALALTRAIAPSTHPSTRQKNA